MGTTTTDTARIRRDIEAAQADLGRVLFVIGDRIAPKKVIERLKSTARMKLAEKVETLKVQLNPPRLLRRAIEAARPGGESDHPGRLATGPSGPPLELPAREPVAELPGTARRETH